MKHSELQKALKPLNLSMKRPAYGQAKPESLTHILDSLGRTLVSIDNTLPLTLNLNKGRVEKLPKDTQDQLFNILNEYLTTPPKERQEIISVFQLKLIGFNDLYFVTYHKKKEAYHLGKPTNTNDITSLFTENDIQNLPEDIKTLIKTQALIQIPTELYL